MMSDAPRTIEVKIPKQFLGQASFEAIQHYFSETADGGRSIEDMCTYEEQGTIQITYANHADAKQVSERRHRFKDQVLDVSLLVPTYTDKLLFRHLPDGATTERLKKFLKKVSRSEVVEIVYGEDESMAVVVSFGGKIDFSHVEGKCQKKKLEGKHVSVEKVPVSKCILVENLSRYTTSDRLVRYFDGKMSHVKGGVVVRGKVVQLRRADSCAFYVYFKDDTVVDELLKQEHCIDGSVVRTKLFLPCLGPVGGHASPPADLWAHTGKSSSTRSKERFSRQRSLTFPRRIKTSSRAALVTDDSVVSDLAVTRPATMAISNGKKKITETLRPIHMRLLVAGSIPEDISRSHNDLFVRMKQHEISFTGPAQDTAVAQADIQQFLTILKTETVILTEGKRELLKHRETFNYIEQRMKEKERLAEFELNPDGDIEVWACSQPDILVAVETIRCAMEERPLSFQGDFLALLASKQWKGLCKTLESSQPGKLVIQTKADDQVLVIATDDVIHDVINQIESFQRDNSFQTEVIHCSNFVRLFMNKEKESIEKDLKSFDVQIFYGVTSKGEDEEVLHLQGTRKGVELAKERLQTLELKVLCHMEKVTEERHVQFLNCKGSRTVLDKIEHDFKCILSFEPDVNHVAASSGQRSTPAPASRPQTGLSKDLYVYHTGSDKSLREIIRALHDRIPENFQTKTVRRVTLRTLDSAREKEMKAICDKHGVDLRLDKQRGVCSLSGEREGLNNAHEQIDELLHRWDEQRIDYVEVKLSELKRYSRLSQPTLPENWASQSQGDELVTKVPLRPSDGEYRQVEANFRATLGSKHVVVSMVHRVQNKTRYQQYTVQKVHLDRQNRGTQNERTLWHGTAPEAIDSIVRHGFNRSYCGKNAKKYGEGVYFALESSYSAFNCYARPDHMDNRYVFQCKVLVGRSTVGTERMKVLPDRAPGVLYDSATDSLDKPSLYVIFSDNNAYPEYLITFRVVDPKIV